MSSEAAQLQLHMCVCAFVIYCAYTRTHLSTDTHFHTDTLSAYLGDG